MSASPANDWFTAQFGEKYAELGRQIGRFNLAIFGKTGVGKSTLVNAIFGADVAKTGIGEPVTQDSQLYLHAGGHFGVVDTQGLEIGRDDARILKDLGEYVRWMRRAPETEHIHVAWYCVRFSDRRFEQTEAAFIRELDRLGLPVLVVLTQVPMINGAYHPDALTLARAIEAHHLPTSGEPVFLTCARADDFAGYPAHGLMPLLDATFRRSPAAAQDALVAAQKIDLNRKHAAAQAAITKAVAAAASAGAVPIPFSDAALLVPIQLAMMASIAHTYDVAMETATVAALAATSAATAAGRGMVTGLIKMVPGVGSVIGGAISASVAGSLTWAMGTAWAEVCRRIAVGQLRTVSGALDNEAVRTVFTGEFQKQLTRRLGRRS